MPPSEQPLIARLEDLPNIGKAIAADLRSIGILRPEQLAEREPLEIYRKLAVVMGHRHDPCILYVLLSARYFLTSGEKLTWWTFTEQGKKLLQGDLNFLARNAIKRAQNN